MARPGLRAAAEGLRYVRSHPILTAAFLPTSTPRCSACRSLCSRHERGALRRIAADPRPAQHGPGRRRPARLGAVGPGRARARRRRARCWSRSWSGAPRSPASASPTLWLRAAAARAGRRRRHHQRDLPRQHRPAGHPRPAARAGSPPWTTSSAPAVPRLGNFEAGAVAGVTSAGFSAVSGGVATVVGALLIRLAFPAVARYRSPVEPVPLSPADPPAPAADAPADAGDAPGAAHAEAPGEQQQATSS